MQTRGVQRFAGAKGYPNDDATGMQLLGARYYLPKLGRFLTQDPIGHEGGLNLYAYCDDSPLERVDPSGLDKQITRNSPYYATIIARINDLRKIGLGAAASIATKADFYLASSLPSAEGNGIMAADVVNGRPRIIFTAELFSRMAGKGGRDPQFEKVAIAGVLAHEIQRLSQYAAGARPGGQNLEADAYLATADYYRRRYNQAKAAGDSDLMGAAGRYFQFALDTSRRFNDKYGRWKL